MSVLTLTGGDLTLGDIAAVARDQIRVALAPESAERVTRAAATIDRIVQENRRTYGVNTGFGALSTETIDAADLNELQVNLLRSHAAGVGEPLSDEVVRAMLLLRANALACGYSGVRPAVIERLLDLLNADLHPVVPSQGSVGASGDLAPLAHLALPLIGEGRLRQAGTIRPTAEVIAEFGWTPLTLGPKEGLALINGTQASAAVGILALMDALNLARHADVIGALSVEAIAGRPSAFESRIHELRPIPGQLTVAANLTRLLEGSDLVTRSADSTQDAYSLRCMPQVHGASREMLGTALRVLEIEANAVTDNPLVFPETGEVVSAGNFHGEPVAQTLDGAAIGIASLCAISERRIDRLVGGRDGLPTFLSARPGLRSGFMLVHVTAASLLNENKHLANPVSPDNTPTSAGKEDHVSFSTYAARKFAAAVRNAEFLLGAELLAATQALDFRDLTKAAPSTRAAQAAVRALVPHLEEDREMHPDLAAAAELIHSRALLDAINPTLSEPVR